VLLTPGQPVTVGYYLPPAADDQAGQMAIHAGQIVQCPPIPETGGCRTNVELKLDTLPEAIDFPAGRHTCLIYGDHADDLRRFCRLMKIDVIG
jgi:hypothetical protein